jgi:hydrogenase small subunit
MAITRRQFVTRLGALAAAAGFSQAQASQIMDALAYSGTGNAPYQGTFGKPRVVWIHGAECTGCSTSLLGIFENVVGEAIPGSGITTATALGLAGTLPTNQAPVSTAGGLLLHDTGVTALVGEPADSINIADVVIDVVDLIYHETVMGMGGDLAYQWLTTFAATNNTPFVLVVEGALQNKANGGAWGDTAAGSVAVPWCSIGMDGTTSSTGAVGEIDMPEMAQTLAESPYCGAVIGIGQCATFGGYPGCKPPITTASAHFDTGKSQTDALGTYDYLALHSNANVAGKVINVPGCPTNPWWFVLSVVCILVDIPSILSAPVNTVGTLGVLKKVAANANNALGIGVNVGGGVDATRRIKAVYGNPIHGPYCPRYRNYVKGVYATQPGDPGCLQKIGCKGPAAKSLCGLHGWNNQQPQNPVGWDEGVSHANPAPNGTTYTGGHCTRAGHPCMACTEKGYPDSFVPFVVR